jgi:small subunit ribosomal protein S8
MNYLVGDFIIRIKNAAAARRRDVVLPYSKINGEIGKVLVKEKYLEKITEEDVDGKKNLRAIIRYEKRQPVLTDVKIISKPSLRSYVKKEELPVLQRKTLSTIILSTSQGVMTAKDADKKGVGGEFLFEVL